MATPRDSRLVKRGPWPRGINNAAPEHAMPSNEFGTRAIALREADNVDFDDIGWPATRHGSAKAVDLTLGHSLWWGADSAFGLVVHDGMLHALDADYALTPLDVEVGHAWLSYATIAGNVYYTNNARCGMVTPDLRHYAWAPEQPAGQPALESMAGGSLGPGRYQVAVTFSDVLGRESGSVLATEIEVVGGTIALTGLPIPQDTDETPTTNVYCTAANGTALFLAFSMPSSFSYAEISAPPTGRALATHLLEPLPNGTIVRYGHGRQWVARGREVLWSEPLRYGLFNPAHNRIRFAAPVDLLEPVGDGEPGAGVYVASGDRTYWLGGADPASFTQRFARPSGVVRYSSARAPATAFGYESAGDVLVWLARDGRFCLGAPGGNVTPLKDGEAAIDTADAAATLFRESNGQRQVVSSLRGPRRNGLAVTDRAIAHVIHEEA
ncbi:MAG: hypothetical protein GX856_04405 [Gammaproteobacteria bacterium]|nr:hypothetical protein [Gammaproteobacteria bacterium]